MASGVSGLVMEQVGNASKVMSLIFEPMRSGRMDRRTSHVIAEAADDFTKLGNLQLKHLKRFGSEAGYTGKLPQLRSLLELLEKEDFPAGVTEAKRIRAEMKGILQQVRDQLRDE